MWGRKLLAKEKKKYYNKWGKKALFKKVFSLLQNNELCHLYFLLWPKKFLKAHLRKRKRKKKS